MIEDEAAARLFLSYHKRNYTLARSLASAIRAEIQASWPNGPRITLWYDESLEPGDQWDEKIQRELELSDIIMFLITPACLSASYMWDDEFSVALERFRRGAGRVRLIPLLYAHAPVRILTDRYTRGLNHLPDKPHDQIPDVWESRVCEGIRRAVEGVLTQRPPPMTRVMPALASARAALELAQREFGQHTESGFFGSVSAGDLVKTLGALEVCLDLPGRERLSAMSIWETKLRQYHVLMRHALPTQSEVLRTLREHLDEVLTFSAEEDIATTERSLGMPISIDQLDAYSLDGVKVELAATKRSLDKLDSASDPASQIELDARAYTVDVGGRHVALADALLDELEIDPNAVQGEIRGVESAVLGYSATLKELGADASTSGTTIASELESSTARALGFAWNLASRSARRPDEERNAQTRKKGASRISERDSAVGSSRISTADGLEHLKSAPPPNAHPILAGFDRSPLPPVSLLDPPMLPVTRENEDEGLKSIRQRFDDALAGSGLRSRVAEIQSGPLFVIFDVVADPALEIGAFVVRAERLARTIFPSVRVEWSSLHRNVRFEVPQREPATPQLRATIESLAFQASSARLAVALGTFSEGRSLVADLAELPHLVVAGHGGTGKTNLISAVVMSLLFKHPPETCRFLLINSDYVSLGAFANLPHLVSPIVSSLRDAASALDWCLQEIESRLSMIRSTGFAHIDAFNDHARHLYDTANSSKPLPAEHMTSSTRISALGPQYMPHIIVVIDDLGELQAPLARPFRTSLATMVKDGPAAGVHLIATTRIAQSRGELGPDAALLNLLVVKSTSGPSEFDHLPTERFANASNFSLNSSAKDSARIYHCHVTEAEAQRVVEWTTRNQARPRITDLRHVT